MDITLTINETALIDEYKRTVYSTTRQFTEDEYNFRTDEELDWLPLAFGWLLGKGVEEIRAYDLALYMRYDLNIA